MDEELQKAQTLETLKPLQALATDHEGAAIFLPRFVSPLAPPPALLDEDPAGPGSKDGTMRRLLRFVSMVPFVEDWAAFRKSGAVSVFTLLGRREGCNLFL
jgi:hypothetical protein